VAPGTAPTAGLALATRNLQKRYGKQVALACLDLSVPSGVVYGFLGPNGAGKTTTMRLLTGLIHPDGGQIELLGQPFGRRDRRRLFDVGALVESPAFYPYLSGRANLRALAASGAPTPGRRIDEVLELVGLTGRENERVEGYSRGMRQRLHIARGIIHDPEVVFLDEPTIGVDPVGARALRSTISGLIGAGKTVLLTTHYMFEADTLCNRVAVIAKGKLVAQGTPRELKSHVVDRSVLEVEVFGVDDDLVRRLRQVPGVTSVSIEDRDQAQVLTIQSPHGLELTATLTEFLDGSQIGRIAAREPTLEDAYVALVTEAEQ
jgi:ABC-2 type transport system ATP-binding protein